MKQARILAKEIRRKQKALGETKSVYLMNDYAKSIYADINELKFYCKQKKLNFIEVMRE